MSNPGRLAAELRHLMGGGYPEFIRSRGSGDGDDRYVPVFTFHTLDPDDFESKLRHLDRNGYRTLSLDRLLEHLRGEAPAPERSVLLTIDDGRLSTWTVGLPMLREYGMRATAFVIPGYLETGPARPTIADGSGRTRGGDDFDERVDRMRLMRWSEVERLHESDAMDVESHGHLHMQVPVSVRVVDYVHPGLDTAPYDVPMLPDRQQRWSPDELRDRLGAPIFGSRPVLATSGAMVPPEEVTERCRRRVAKGGGKDFFERPGWRDRLDSEVSAVPADRFRQTATRPAQLRELRESRRVLERRLAGKTVRHFCLPRGEGRGETGRHAEEAGYHTLLWGLLPEEETNRPGCSPYRVERVKHDFIHRLPGDGRRGICSILAAKAARRLRGRSGY